MTTPLAAGGSEARAEGSEVGGSGDLYFLNDRFTSEANIQFRFGREDDQVYFGDWDGDGRDTPMLRRGATFQYANANATGAPLQSFIYGRADDVVMVGDWNGDGRDTLAVRRGGQFHIRNVLANGAADEVIYYGRPTDNVLVGDWNGDGFDTFAVRRGAEYHVRNSMTSGPADLIVHYGRADDRVLVGDWDGDGRDSFAVRRQATYYIANEIRPGQADIVLIYGRAADVAFSGDWNGDGADTLGVRRVAAMPSDPVNCSGYGQDQADPAVCRAMSEGSSAVLALVNEERAARDLPALHVDPCLQDVAQRWSESMAWLETSGGAHNPQLDADMRACGMRGWAENVASSGGNSPAARVVMDRWLASSAHYANLTSANMTHVGVGVASTGNGRWYYVVDFGRR
ncbi:CAP domain-containing protein [Agrococcus terreus]|uniref:CAP domain-containing protein n=1 Tax=Agrococcus terreus TaxID=574649 RepID=UPI00384D3077